MRFMRVMDTMTPPSGAIAPPMRPVPEPRGTIGTCSRAAEAHDGLHLRRRLGEHHRVGGALVERVHVALVGEPALGRDHEAGGADDALERAEELGSQGHGGVSG